MKFVLNVVALVVGVALCTPRVQSFSNNKREFVLGVMANDRVWAKHLAVDIKLHPEKLTTAAREVLEGMELLNPWPKHDKVAVEEAKLEQEEEKVLKQAEESGKPVVIQALRIVTDVASSYNNHGVALEFAMDAIALAIKCKTLKYVLVQLFAIQKVNELQNEEISSQPNEVWNTLVHVLDKVAMLKDSMNEEFEMYQQCEVITKLNMTKKLPKDFKNLMTLVANTLEESCVLCSFADTVKQLNLNVISENWESAVGATNIFIKCREILKGIINEIPISTVSMGVWEKFLDKPEFIEPTEPPFPTAI